mmetsp:Transcript_148/g.371  ORF Transcript_148/g.371 Transcript_148/m.371 type:complete len:400 (-) Transcript_148:414-1613(-)|eukprot:CAMPEP_0168302088 /NCGR_PEP_ID=MMETSP0142_2-20121227/37583_1 /TAXON_ID=44445 /ORGANISM="Pseudo-nitzschia australis, Strain 10249 10 AB" /LENGTH=399 /DNA_ID=CAMNT_0008252575 /DNA_START=293 /DNA_END=1492 /DNA_ORIENTATION=-
MEHKQELGHKEPTLHEIQQLEMDQAHHDIHYNNNHHKPNQLVAPLPSSLTRQNDADAATAVATASTTTTTEDEQEVSFFHDFVAGGIAGSASVVVGHPMDTLKVRIQTTTGNPTLTSLAMGSKYGGPVTLFRGMAAPLSAASIVNAIIFSSYGWSTRFWDQNMTEGYDPHLKAFACGSFAGLVQGLVICPMEHVKCRLQIQEAGSAAIASHPLQTTLRSILTSGGKSANISALYRGWWITCWREIPAFGGYFTLYDIFKDRIEDALDDGEVIQPDETTKNNHADATTAAMLATTTTIEPPKNTAHTWIASALAGGLTGAVTWAIVYPFDVIKTKIQTAPIDTPRHERTISAVVKRIVKQHGWNHMFRGLTVTCLRAFPVNGIIFPVYEYTLLHLCAWES